jgi:hypothetical protein
LALLLLQEEELSRQRRREAAEAARAADRLAAQQRCDEEADEKQQLLGALRGARKAKADELGQVWYGCGQWVTMARRVVVVVLGGRAADVSQV